MSAWNELMQSMHSALIDELNERYPSEKPTLGLPKRFSGWTLLEEATQAIHLTVTLEGGTGVCILAGGKGQKLSDLQKILLAVAKRAESEFTRRKITPTFGAPIEAPRSERPRALPNPSLLIFFPIRIRPDRADTLIFDLAVGV